MNRRVVQNDDQGFSSDLFVQMVDATQEHFSVGVLLFWASTISAVQPGGHNVEVLATWGMDAMLLTATYPSTAVGVNLCKACLIEVGQLHFPWLHTLHQQLDVFAGLFEGNGISFFLSQWRVRFQTKSSRLSAATSVLRCTRVPCAWA